MKRSWWQAYLHYSRAERMGITALLVLIILLLIAKPLLPLFVKKEISSAEERRLQVAMQQFQQELPADKYAFEKEEDFSLPTTKPFPFDPNTLDSTGFIALGLRSKTIQKLLNWRRKGKVFYRPEQFKDVWTLRPDEYERLVPYIAIAQQVRGYAGNYLKYERFKQEPLPEHIELNSTDSAMLVRLNGIGPTLAHKIIQKRSALGGFIKHEQLNEVYRFPDTTFAMLREKLNITPDLVKKIRFNTATEAELASHPYIGDKMAKNIILLRDGLHGFQTVQQLRQVPLMNEENYRKLAPYFSIQ